MSAESTRYVVCSKDFVTQLRKAASCPITVKITAEAEDGELRFVGFAHECDASDSVRLDALESAGVRLKVSLGGTRWFTVREPVRLFVDRMLLNAGVVGDRKLTETPRVAAKPNADALSAIAPSVAPSAPNAGPRP